MNFLGLFICNWRRISPFALSPTEIELCNRIGIAGGWLVGDEFFIFILWVVLSGRTILDSFS